MDVMRNLKRFLIVGLAWVFVTVAFAGCAVQGQSSSNKEEAALLNTPEVVNAEPKQEEVVTEVKEPEVTEAKAEVPPSNATSSANIAPATTSVQTYKAPAETYKAPAPSTNYYINVDGNKVQSPTYAPSKPAGASAKCKDGTYSFSQNKRGTCSGHGGVGEWY